MDEYAKLELNASRHGWNCSKCNLFIDCMGRPIFGKEMWSITSKGTAWIENKPPFRYCPGCGSPMEGDRHG